jgi:hypothetical protein
MKTRFKVKLMEEAVTFLSEQEEKAREKIIYNLNKVPYVNDKDLLKKLSEEIWEFRTLYNKTAYRLFAFWDKRGDEEALVIATRGMIKKTDKIPFQQLIKTMQLRKHYFEQKNYEKKETENI